MVSFYFLYQFSIISSAQKNTISYEEAEDVATAALILDPKFLKARYRRGLARKEQNLLKGAMTGLRAF